MKTNSCGFPELESFDLSSPVGVQQLALFADAKFQAQERDIDFLERPEVIVGGVSGTSTYTDQFPPNGQSVNFDTTLYVSRPSAYAFSGIFFSPDWRPGIYIGGCNLFFNTTAPVDSIMLDLKLEDPRGPRLLNKYHQVSSASTGDSSMTTERMSAAMMFEVHTPKTAFLAAYIDIANTGFVTLQTNSVIWALRIRGLSDA